VKFTGVLSSDQVANLLASSDIFALCSKGFDNHPMATLEAMSAGLPIVYSDPNLRHEIGRDAGICTDGTLEGLAQALAFLISDRILRESMSLAAAKRGEQYDIERVRGRLRAAYESAAIAQ
jgi:glycosyltransferase involved in cell wall biosynthesis